MSDSSLRMSLFQRLATLQMWLLTRLMWYVALIYLASMVFFALLRLFTGISIKRIGYFSLRHIVFHPKQGVEIRIGKLGLVINRPTVARPTILSFEVSNFEVLVDPAELIESEEEEISQKSPKDFETSDEPQETEGSERNDSSNPRRGSTDSTCQPNLDPVNGIPLLPHSKPHIFKFMRWLVTTMRVIDVQFHSVSLIFAGFNNTVLTTINLRLDLRKTLNYKKSNFVGTLDSYQLRENELPISAKLNIVDVYTAESLEDETPWQIFEDLRLDVSGVLELDSMKAKEIGIQMHSGRLQIDANNINEILNKVKKIRASKAPKRHEMEEENKQKVLSSTDQKRIEHASRVMLHLVNRIQITIGKTQFLRIPMQCNDDEKFSEDDTVFFAMSMKDLNVDLTRFNSHSSGFKLYYGEDDIAHQIIGTVSSFNLGIDNGSQQEEILYVPLLTNLSRGNFFSQTLNYIQSRRLGENRITNESKVRSRFGVHAPTVSIEENHLPTLVRVALGFADSKKNSRNGDNRQSEVRVPMQDSLPNFDVELLISDLTSRMICAPSKNCQNSMFVANSSRMMISYKSHHEDPGEYKMSAKFETLDDHVWYHSSNTERLDVAYSRSTEVTVNALTLPRFQVEIEGRQLSFEIAALRHEIFCSIGQLHASIRRPIIQWHNKHKGHRIIHENNEPVHKGSLLREVPKWLVSFHFEADNSSVAFASNQFRGQTNDVLGVKLVTKELVIHYEAENHNSTDERYLLFTGRDSILFKADSFLFDFEGEDTELLSSHGVAQLPKLSLEARTLSGNACSVDINIEPRLKIDLNINLILAFSVLKENIGKALLHHLKPEDIDDLSPEVSAFESQKRPTGSRGKHIISVIVPRALIKVDMPSDDQIMLELGNCLLKYENNKNPELHAKSLRLYAEHPMQSDAWCIISSFMSLDLEFNSCNPKAEDKIQVDVDGVWINVPYKFKLYRIIDNGITLAKAIKTLILQTNELDPMLVLQPKRIEGVPSIPRTHLKTKQLLVSLEDDYFEADLTLVMLTMRESNMAQTRKAQLFGLRIKEMLQIALKGLNDIVIGNKEAPNQKESVSIHQNDPSKEGSPDKHLNNASSAPNGETQEESTNGNMDRQGSSSVNSRIMNDEDGVTDKVVHAVEYFKRGTHNILEQSHNFKFGGVHQKYSSNRSSPEGVDVRETKEEYHHQIVESLSHISREEIEILLDEEIELGCPADDGDKVLAKSNVWLNFWSSHHFSKFRAVTIMLGDGESGSLSIGEAREALLADISRLWVDSIRNQRKIQHSGTKARRNQVVQDHFDHGTCSEEKIVEYSQKPLVMSIDFRQLDLVINQTTHNTPEKLSNWMNELGKGQPKDSEYSILVPLFIDLKAHGGLRVDLKDFPLPVLNFPPLARNQNPKTNLALQIKGDLVITEQLLNDERCIRRLFVPLKPLPREKREQRDPDVIEVHRTLTPIKTVTDLKFLAGSTLPIQVCWCKAYQPGFHSVGEAFSGFSKPPIDPSPALGAWDKIRLVLHARFDFKIPKSPLCLQMKAGKSPYGLLNGDSGFIFLWKDDVHVQINPNDDPTKLFLFESNCFELLVPNYISWEAEYLRSSPAERAFPRKRQLENLQSPEKVVFSFAQRTTWKLGMSFEKADYKTIKGPNKKSVKVEQRNKDFRPHYDVKLSLPEYIDNIDEYDAYDGFRSDFIHMSISVVNSNHESVENLDPELLDEGVIPNKCACHLTMGVIKHFKIWKDQFNSEQWPPIKTGSLFPDPVRVRPSKKTFGTALSTAIYEIKLNTLDLGFFERLRNQKNQESHDRSTGIKAKIKNCELHWHTRREPPSSQSDFAGESNVELSGNRRWRMQSFLAQIRLQSVQMRVIEARLKTQSSKAALKALDVDDVDSDDENGEDTASSSDASTKFDKLSFGRTNSEKGSQSPNSAHGSHPYGPSYVGDNYWIDIDDFTELGIQKNLRSWAPDVRVLPFLYTPEFCYIRRSDFSGKAVYRDSESGDVFPKFGDVDVEIGLEENDRPERKQRGLLETRLGHLEEHISVFKTSLDSFEGSTQTFQQKQRIHELRELLAIGKVNRAVLKEDMDRLDIRAKEEDRRFKKIREETSNDLKNALSDFSDEDKTEKPARRSSNVEPQTNKAVEHEASIFINRYVIHAIHLKWNNSVRNLIYRLQNSLSDDKELNYVRCRPAVKYLEDLVDKAENMAKEQLKGDTNSFTTFKSDNSGRSKFENLDCASECEKTEDEPSTNEKPSKQTKDSKAHSIDSKDRLNHFFNDLKGVKDNEVALKSHSIFFSSPRIQIIDEENPSKCLEIVSRDISVEVVDTYSKGADMTAESSKIERRIGSMLNNAGFFVLSEEDVEQPGVGALCLERYSGEEENVEKLWPPWLAIEMCYNSKPLEQFMVVENISFAVRFDQPNDLHIYQGDKSDISDSKKVETFDRKEVEKLENFNDDEDVSENSDSIAGVADGTKDSKDDDDDDSSRLKNHLPHRLLKKFNSEQDDGADEDSEGHGIPHHLKGTLNEHGHHKDGRVILSSLVLDAPQLVVKYDSIQFYTLYKIAVDLLTYQDPLLKKRDQAINRVFLSNDFQEDYRAGLFQIKLLQDDIREILRLKEMLTIRKISDGSNNREVEIHLIRLNQECLRRQTRLMVLMRAFKASLRKNMNTGVDKITKWSLLADSLVMRLLNEQGNPMVELFLKRCHFSQLSNEDHGSINHVSLSGLLARNLLPDSIYPHMVANYESTDVDLNDNLESGEPGAPTKAIKMKWTRLDRVGGISMLDEAEAWLKPIHIQVEHGFFDKMLDFAFPITESKENEKKSNSDDENSDSDDSSDSDSDSVSDASSDVSISEIKSESRGALGKKKKKRSFFHKITRSKFKSEKTCDVDVMLQRASNYWSIRSLIIHPTQLTVSYQGKAAFNILNIQNVEIPFPAFEVHNKTWTKLDLIMKIKKLAIKVLLAQSGSIIGNKFKPHKHHAIEDDRDLDLERLTSQNRELLSGLHKVTEDSERANSVTSIPKNALKEAIKVEEDPKMLLIPVHRRKAIENPENSKEVIRQSLGTAEAKSREELSGSRKTPSGLQSIRNFSLRNLTRDNRSSSHSLRQNSQELGHPHALKLNKRSFSFKRSVSRGSDLETSSISSITSKSSKFLDKIRRGLNNNNN